MNDSDPDSDFQPPTQKALSPHSDSGESAEDEKDEYPELSAARELYDKGTKIHFAPRMKRLYFKTWEEFDEEFEAYCKKTTQICR